MDNEKNKESFKKIVSDYIHRDGIDSLMKWLEKSDFYTAPASTRFHLSCEGGLLQHSLNVYDEAIELSKLYLKDEICNGAITHENIAISALFHDLCKANCYKVEKRNKKDENGQWHTVDAYTFKPDTPWGHSQKSVILLQNFMKLTRDEIDAVLGHMGFSDAAFKGGDGYVGDILEESKLAVVIHMADLVASKIVEANE